MLKHLSLKEKRKCSVWKIVVILRDKEKNIIPELPTVLHTEKSVKYATN